MASPPARVPTAAWGTHCHLWLPPQTQCRIPTRTLTQNPDWGTGLHSSDHFLSCATCSVPTVPYGHCALHQAECALPTGLHQGWAICLQALACILHSVIDFAKIYWAPTMCQEQLTQQAQAFQPGASELTPAPSPCASAVPALSTHTLG